MATWLEKQRDKAKREKLAREMTHQAYTPYQPAVEARQGIGQWAQGVGERSTPQGMLSALASEANRYRGMPISELAVSFGPSGGGLVGSIGRKAKTEFELAHELAQRNAALPVEQGGLGLPPNNTAMDRAKAMGFDMNLYHGTAKNIESFDPLKYGINTRQTGGEIGTFATSKDYLADSYADIAAKGGWAGRTDVGNQVVYPLLARTENPKRYETASKFYQDMEMAKNKEGLNEYGKSLIKQGHDSVIVRPDMEEVALMIPSNIRSRFAAFDPMQRKSANILAGGAAGAVGLSTLADLMNQQEYQ